MVPWAATGLLGKVSADRFHCVGRGDLSSGVDQRRSLREHRAFCLDFDMPLDFLLSFSSVLQLLIECLPCGCDCALGERDNEIVQWSGKGQDCLAYMNALDCPLAVWPLDPGPLLVK